MHLLTSQNFLRELQTSIHIILAHQCHNFLALSTLGLKCKKKPFHVLVSKSGMRCLVNTKICPRNLSKKETKRALLNILETEDSYKEPDDIMLKFKHSKIELNSTSSTIFFIHLEKRLDFFSFTMNICHFPFFLFFFFFFCVSFCPVMLYFFIFILFPV